MAEPKFELWDNSKPDVTFAPAPVSFPAFPYYMKQAGRIADYIRDITVTEDNVKEVKKTLAAARKVTDELSKRRIAIKKAIMSQYDDFADQVNQLSAVIDKADSEVRVKVRELEEKERQQKKEEIRAIWDKRSFQYRIHDLLPGAFDRWLSPIHLNKSASMKSVEADMTDWLEETEKALNTLSAMDDEYTVEYLGCLDLAQAISAVNQRREVEKTVKASKGDYEEIPKKIFIVTGKKDIELTRMLLNQNEINYEEK